MRRSPIPATLTVCALVTLAAVALGLGCSSSSPSGPDDNGGDDQPGEFVYVDPSYVGEELGTQDKPFNTIEEGIDAAGKGDIVVLAAGTYAGRTDIDVPRVMTIRGAGAGSSIVDARFSVSADPDTQAVRIKSLSCEEVMFWGNRAELVVDPGDTVFAPIVVDSCAVDTVDVGYPATHSYTIRNSVITYGVGFNHGYVFDSALNEVRNCMVGRGVRFAHGGGDVTNIVENCSIAGAVTLLQGAGSTNTISSNTVNGILDSSGACATVISNNVLPTGDLVDKSGGWGSEDQFIEWNEIENGVVILTSGNATCRYNTINAPAETIALKAYCGAPANVVGNTITLPYEELDPETYHGIGILASCGAGVVTDNTITGGALGILDRCAATEISGNVISGAHMGMFLGHPNGKDIRGNTVTGCVADGVVVERYYVGGLAYGVFEDNTFADNGGAGLRLLYPADVGGGAQNSLGGNVLTGNGDYDLVVEVPADTAAVIYARHNTWDHATEGEIDSDDVYDANDDGSLADVDFMPLGSGGGAW